jgi:UDP-N-acetylmuramoyl-tripeptide--D-alanyl-D-alanine ligase
LCAISIALKLGIGDDAIVSGLEKVKPLFGRGEVLRGAVTVIQDCYNANTDSMRHSIDFVGTLPWTGRKILVLGSMKELGSSTESEHRLVGRCAADSSARAVFFYGDESAAAFREAEEVQGRSAGGKLIQWTDDFDTLERLVQTYIKPGDLLLLKASRGVELERLTNSIIEMDL